MAITAPMIWARMKPGTAAGMMPENVSVNDRAMVTAGLAIYDTLHYIRPKVSTVCIGQAASMGSLLLCSGTKGKRYALPNSRIMMHQPSGGTQGQAADIEIQAREILKLRERLNAIYAEHTGQKLEVIEEAVDRDRFMSPEDALEFGLIDEIVVERPPLDDDDDDADGKDENKNLDED